MAEVNHRTIWIHICNTRTRKDGDLHPSRFWSGRSTACVDFPTVCGVSKRLAASSNLLLHHPRGPPAPAHGPICSPVLTVLVVLRAEPELLSAPQEPELIPEQPGRRCGPLVVSIVSLR